ncbi:MAG: GspE/PulE family protein [Candidatus Gracilibacteria bacterium]
MKLEDVKIREALAKGDYVSEENLNAAEVFAKEHSASIVEYLFFKGFLTRDLLGQAIAEMYGVTYADLNSKPIVREAVLRIPEEISKKYEVVLIGENETEVTIATTDPSNAELPQVLSAIFPNKKIAFAYAMQEDFESVFIYYRKPLNTRFVDILKTEKHIAPEIIEEIFRDAFLYRASDIHFEPQENEVVIRFRIDGVLHEAGRIQKEFYENILNRIKVQAHLRIDEHFAVQDGSIRYERKAAVPVDMRISIAPTINGEKIVIRLLAEYVQSLSLYDLGLSYKNQKVLTETAQKPFGMILVTGATGSGKTTTLYALLKSLNTPEVNITTIEDPVEYKVVGINQIQVNPQTDITFAAGLRSIARQDPNIILVGEIRDRETAEIAVNAALTGHLLLSTFHSNDAATSIPRLLNMGVEPFLMASTLELVIAQRLVRTVCKNCRYGMNIKRDEIAGSIPNAGKYFPEDVVTLYKGKGCESCAGTGYKGRTAVFEFMKITPDMRDLILKNPSTKQIWELARKEGAVTLFEDGIDKVKSGITTLEDLLRITTPPTD